MGKKGRKVVKMREIDMNLALNKVFGIVAVSRNVKIL